MDFMSILVSINPSLFKCPGCNEDIKVSLWYSIPLTIVVLGSAFGIWAYTEHLDLRFKVAILFIAIFTLVAELLYFMAIKWGLVTTTLVDEAVWQAEEQKERTNHLLGDDDLVMNDEVEQEEQEQDSVNDSISQEFSDSTAQEYLIVPRIKNKLFLDAIKDLGDDSDKSMPIAHGLFGDLILTYAIDVEDSYIALSQTSAEEFNINTDDLLKKAAPNALSALSQIQMFSKNKLFQLSCPDNMIACSVLFPALWDQIESEAGGAVVIGVPHRDAVFYTLANDQKGINELKTLVDQCDFNETHALSKNLYTRHEESWKVFEA